MYIEFTSLSLWLRICNWLESSLRRVGVSESLPLASEGPYTPISTADI